MHWATNCCVVNLSSGAWVQALLDLSLFLSPSSLDVNLFILRRKAREGSVPALSCLLAKIQPIQLYDTTNMHHR
jgi:hypothetical protein